MGNPLRDMDKQQLLLEQINRVNALAVANNVEPLNLGPLARMALSAAMKQVHDKNNEVIVVLEGTQIVWGGPLKDPAAAAQVLDQSMDYTDTLEPDEGGGGVPEWVIEDQPVGTDPDTISHHIRLYGGSAMAWERGVGEVSVDTLLGADPNSSSFDTTEYDPGDLTALGLVPGLPVAFIGSARTKYLDGATLLIRSEQFEGAGPGYALWVVAMSADGEDYIHTIASNESNGNTTRVYSIGGTLDETFPNTITYGTGTINRTGVTFVSDRIDVSSNGDVAFTSEVTTEDRPPGNPFVCALFQANPSDAISSITFFDPLASGAGLPALTEVP